MKTGRVVGAVVLAFVAFALVSFLFHNVIFASTYMAAGKNPADVNTGYILAACAIGVLMLTYFMGRASVHNWQQGAWFGCVFVGTVMAVFGVLNLALVPGWPWIFVILDFVWALIDGAIAGAIIAAVGFRK